MIRTLFVFSMGLAACGAGKDGAPGPAGPTGPQGPAGQTGATGAAGANGVVTPNGTTDCSVLDSGARFEYSTALFGDGSRFVSCGISGNSFTVSDSRMYAASEVGATTGNCLVTYDFSASPAAGYWSFTLSPLQAEYNDVGSAQNGNVVSFATSDCSTH